jgi:DHA1 family multidrug resistance protein-like MFS transporter
MTSSWRRTYWVVWLANLVTAIGMMSFLPFFPSLLEEMGVDDPTAKRAWAGAIFGAAPLSATLMSPIWGALGDRFGRKLMVCRSMIAICLFVGAMYWASMPWHLLTLRLGQGLFSGFIPPSITLVSVGAPPERQGRVAGDLTTALALGGLIGPGLGGAIAVWTGSRRDVFLFVGVAALLSAALVALFAAEDKSLRQQRTGRMTVRAALRETGADVGGVLASPLLRSMAVVVFALQLGLGSVNPLLELHVRDVLGAQLGGWSWVGALFRFDASDRVAVETFATGMLFTVMGLANLVSLPVWGRYGDAFGHRRALILCALGSVVALVIQATASGYPLLLAGRALMGVAMAGTGPLAFGMAAAETGADRRGSAFGVVFSARTLAVAVGATAGGLASPWIGVRGVMTAGAVVVAAALWGFLRSGPRDQAASSATTR